MGFDGKSPPRPPYDPTLSKIGKAHVMTWWNDRGKKQQSSCTCATGKNHSTPREGR